MIIITCVTDDSRITSPNTSQHFPLPTVSTQAARVMTDAGFDNVEVVSYWPYLSYPEDRYVKLSVDGNVTYEAVMEEPEIPDDPSSKGEGALMTFLAYSANGTIEAGEYVYVNYGRRVDYQAVADAGVVLKGKIAIARFGGSFRGLKVRDAEEFGCVGIIIYSDPADDGAALGETYPDGPWRNPQGVQRGSIQYISEYSGDPLTPGYAATKDAPRIDPASDDANLPRIPAVPLSAADAYPLLKALNGGVKVDESAGFVGGYPDVDYSVAHSKQARPSQIPKIDLHVQMRAEVTEAWNAIGMIEGAEAPDEWIVMGCHHDAWTFGAADPMSGHSILMETARVFGELMNEGWRPRRTIVMASWTAEEYGLVGSTEFVEDRAQELSNKTIAYLNLDMPIGGPDFLVNASPILKTIMYEVAHQVKLPEDLDNYFNVSTLYEAWAAADARDTMAKYRPAIGYLGSGSDFTPFLQYLGVSSIDFGTQGAFQDPSKPKSRSRGYPSYHSNHDSYHYFAEWLDPGFATMELISHVYGLLALRMANDEIVSLDVMEYAITLSEEMHLLRSHLAECFKDDPSAAVQADDALSRATAALEMFVVAAAETDAEIRAMTVDGARVPIADAAALNDRLRRVERAFIAEGGAYGRTPYYAHVAFAPGDDKGYGATVFPAVSEAGDNKDLYGVVLASAQLAEAIERAAAVLHNGRHQPPEANLGQQ